MTLTIVAVTLLLVQSYLFGSIPTSLVIGKVFFNTDIRQHGSGNLGGTNAGRVLGKKVGLAVAGLDILKVVIGLLIASLVVDLLPAEVGMLWQKEWLLPLVGAAGVLGHSYPIFAQFKGGKAVSSVAAIVLFTNYWLALIGLITFFTSLKVTKYVSFSSMLASLTLTVVSLLIPLFPISGMINMSYSLVYSFALALLTGLLIWRHRTNIDRLVKGTERKVTWL